MSQSIAFGRLCAVHWKKQGRREPCKGEERMIVKPGIPENLKWFQNARYDMTKRGSCLYLFCLSWPDVNTIRIPALPEAGVPKGTIRIPVVPIHDGHRTRSVAWTRPTARAPEPSGGFGADGVTDGTKGIRDSSANGFLCVAKTIAGKGRAAWRVEGYDPARSTENQCISSI